MTSRRSIKQRAQEAWRVASTAVNPDRPMLVHIVPMRRCNLSCAYCNEYDDHSDPVPLEEMNARVDALARLGTGVVTISGGEPMLHPDLPAIIRRISDHGMVPTLITNGYFLQPKRIEELNDAGLQRLQISIDNVTPDEVSKKSLKVLDKKLQNLAKHATFDVNINSVLGAGVALAQDALVIAKRAIELGFTATMGVIHDETGRLKALSPEESKVYEAFKGLDPFSLTRFNRSFQENLVAGRSNKWRCRAGARFLYISEDGLVHYCSQQRGYPGTPLKDYGLADVRREHGREKACAPFCTIACVHQASVVDRFRHPQSGPLFTGVESADDGRVRLPLA